MSLADQDDAVSHGLALLARAREDAAAGAIRMLTDWADAELRLRESLGGFASAMNWLEDTEHFDSAHAALDDAGSFIRRAFGCTLHEQDGKYEQRCPVAIAHKRIGFSAETIIRKTECSVCGRDQDDCPHIGGRIYDGTRCYRTIMDAEFVGVAMVGRPAQPDARLLGLPMDHAGLQAALGSGWHPGMEVSCDRCLTDCEGVEELDFTELASRRTAPNMTPIGRR